jgi:V/A-type H+-transporting ATPase subunit E
MSLEKILERIEQDAQGEVDRIKSRASKTVDEILKKAQDEAEALQAQALEDARIEAEQRKERLISTANLDLRKARLAEKQDAIDAAFREAVESLLNMEDAEYRSIMRGMILPNVQTGDEEIILSEKDKAGLGEELLEEVNRQLIETGKKGKLTLSRDTYNILGGFILRRGKIELNSSFETLFKSSRDDLESEVSKILFPESSEA